MQKQVILLMESEQYPFGEFDHASFNAQKHSKNVALPIQKVKGPAKIRVLVRKIFPTKSLQERNELLQKIGIIRNLQHPNIIKIQSVLEEQNGIHILMEYVPCKLNQYLTKYPKDSYDQIVQSIHDLERNLREQGIGVQWNVGYLGLTENHQCKYLINVNKMHIEPDSSKLYKANQRQINTLLRQVHSIAYPINSTLGYKAKNRKKSSLNLSKQTLNLQKFDPQSSCTSNNNNRSRQSIQPQTPSQKARVNWRQIQQNSQILNDFINVLEDRQDNNTHLGQMKNRIQKNNEEDQELDLDNFRLKGKQKQEVANKDNWEEEMEEVVWETTSSLKDKVNAAIERSKRVMDIFRSVTGIRQ